MKTFVKLLPLALAVFGLIWIYNWTDRTFFVNAGIAGGAGVTPVVTPKDCTSVTEINFAIAVDSRGPILAITPGAQPQNEVLKLQHVSQLETSMQALCSGFTQGSTRCGEINAFTWGYDWIPLKNPPEQDSYCLDSLISQSGWAIMYFVRDNDIYGLGWGDELDQNWPLSSNTNLIRIQNSSYPTTPAQKPLFQAANLDLAGKQIVGLDFNAWVNPIGVGGVGGTQNCFPLPPGSQQHPGRLYYAAPYDGKGGSGLRVWYTHPVQGIDELWSWSKPALLGNDPILQLPPDAEIDSLAFDQRPIDDGAGVDHRHLMISVVLEDAPWPPVDPSRPNEGPGSYYIVPVAGDDGVATFGEPKPLYIQLDPAIPGDPGDQVLLQAIIGPRSRGTCPTDPALYGPRGRAVEASSPTRD